MTDRAEAWDRLQRFYIPWARAWFARHNFTPPSEVVRRWVRAAKRLQRNEFPGA
jgi:hypothetical protein